MNDSIVKLAIKSAKKSPYKYQLGAVVIKGDKVYSSGFNHLRYVGKNEEKFVKYSNSIHAEVHAVKNCKTEIEGKDVVVVRLKYDDRHFGLSKPCPSCMNYLKSVGVRKVIYTTDTSFEVIKI